MKVMRIGVALVLLCVSLAACGKEPGVAVVVGSSDDIDQVVIGQLTVMMLEEYGYDVVDRVGMGSMDGVRSAFESGRVDILWAYSGDVWQDMLEHDQPIKDSETLLRRINEDEAANGLTWLGPWTQTRSATIVTSPTLASTTYSISGLASYMSSVDPSTSVCVPEGMMGAVSGLSGLIKVYGMDFLAEAIITTDQEGAYNGVAEGTCDCALGYTDSLQVRQLGLVSLVDNLGFFPVSYIVVGVNQRILDDPDLTYYLEALGDSLSYETLDDLVDDYVSSDESDLVLKTFLRNNDLLSLSPENAVTAE